MLGAVPTISLLLLLYLMYHLLVYRPLERILSERRARTEGAVEKARADIAAAEAKAAEYENRLSEAKVAIFKAQDARRQQAQQTRTAAVAHARAKADVQVKEARAALERDVASAKTSLQSEVERLADAIIHTILRTTGTTKAPVGGQS